MYAIDVAGDGVTARATLLACQLAGFTDLNWDSKSPTQPELPAWTLSANLSRVINALGRGDALKELGHLPDREQIRIAESGFLLAELPLGRFAEDRYSAPHVNIDHDDLLALLLPKGVEHNLRRPATVTVDTIPRQNDAPATHTLWHARTSEDIPIEANVTWLGTQAHAWQFSTSKFQHVLFSTAAGSEPAASPWHESLAWALESCEPIRQFDLKQPSVREHWYAGNTAYAGDACFSGIPYRREAIHLGLEDAWVLSRMLENYEEDFADGLAEYERYRGVRVRRVARQMDATIALYDRSGSFAKLLRNLNIALAARFLPEIAMQRIDWLYNYDCIRGFR